MMDKAIGVGWHKTGVNLCADPIYRYVELTYPRGDEEERTEKDLLDSPWLQRLRQIHQLQSTWWVYPSAEHSRLQHVLGSMHLAGRFGQTLYESLRETVRREEEQCPSRHFVEETLRVAGLLHDVGHGPFGHFFDEHYLEDFGITHETIGQEIITNRLSDTIRGIHRSPSGPFDNGEELDPQHIAFLIKKPDGSGQESAPYWLRLLLPLFSGIYTVDNLDYVVRDAYMAGIAMVPVNVERLLFYSFYSDKGLTLHESGRSTLRMFAEARRYLYDNLYYHRTARAIDLHMQEIFKATLKKMYAKNPLDDLDDFCTLTDWRLLHTVASWPKSEDEEERRLGTEWQDILNRKVKWKMADDRELSYTEIQPGTKIATASEVEAKLKRLLPENRRDIEFKVDMVEHDPRPENPRDMGELQISIFDPATQEASPIALHTLFRDIPFKVIRFRVYSESHEYSRILADATAKLWGTQSSPAYATNV